MSESVAVPGLPVNAGTRPMRRRPAVPNAVLGMLVAVVVEIMFFSGFVSAFIIARKSLPPVLWPPPDQPRLPVADTAINTAILLASGIACWLGVRLVLAGAKGATGARRWLLAAFVGGLAFVALQGVEWSQLLGGGLTLQSSLAGSYFYMLIGAHALHVIGGLCGLAWALRRQAAGTLTGEQASAVRVFWTFVVVLWPVLYWLVYLP